MRIDMPTCQYGEDHCKKHFDGNCLLKTDLLDERCPIRRTINDVLDIIDKADSTSDDTSAFDVGYTKACLDIRAAVNAMGEDTE